MAGRKRRKGEEEAVSVVVSVERKKGTHIKSPSSTSSSYPTDKHMEYAPWALEPWIPAKFFPWTRAFAQAALNGKRSKNTDSRSVSVHIRVKEKAIRT